MSRNPTAGRTLSIGSFIHGALAWAAKQRTGRASDKGVLVALALHVNCNTGCCFPSVAQLQCISELDRKTVLRALARLSESGLIVDTGHRMGRTGQVKVWRLAWSSFGRGGEEGEFR